MDRILRGAEEDLLRNDFSSSRLVRLLGPWVPVEAEAPTMDFAERLSLWVNAFDAIGLEAAHRAIRAIDAPSPRRPRVPPVRAEALHDDVRRVRSALAHAISQDVLPLPGEAGKGFAPYHQRHLDLQRQMEQMVRPLREHVREALARVSTRLRKLVALDAALGEVLARREQAVMSTAATLLKPRFEQLRKAGEPVEAFESDWRQALLAELDLRLEPVLGLVEALHHELTDNE